MINSNPLSKHEADLLADLLLRAVAAEHVNASDVNTAWGNLTERGVVRNLGQFKDVLTEQALQAVARMILAA